MRLAFLAAAVLLSGCGAAADGRPAATPAEGPSDVRMGALSCEAFESGTAGPPRDGIGEATPEAAADGLVTFGRAFDPVAHTVAVSVGGRVTYTDAAGAVVADAIVRPGKDGTWLPSEARVCKSAIVAGAAGAEPVVFDVRPNADFEFGEPTAGAGVDDCGRLPGTSRLIERLSLPPGFQVTVSGAEAIEAFRACVAGVDGYDAVPATQIEPPVPIPVLLEPTGAQVCLSGGDCAALPEPVARGLSEALLREARPFDGDSCAMEDVEYTVVFVDSFKQHAEISVPRVGSCVPVTVLGGAYTVPDGVKEQIGKAHRDQAVTRSAPLTPNQEAFIESCVRYEGASLVPELVGLTEDEFSSPPGADTNRRVIGRDGQCLDRPEDQTGNRVSAVVEDGMVIWAGRFSSAPAVR